MVADDPLSTVPPPRAARDPHATRYSAPGAGGPGEDRAAAEAGPSLRVVGNYVIERELGRGGMGVVYLAAHAQLRDRRYAVKLMSGATASPAAAEQFRGEVKAIGKSHHPNLLYAIDAGTHGGSLYLVTEFVEGQDLGRILRDRGPLPPAIACEIGRQIATGLAFAHANGIVHRDVKPQNVILQPNGQVKILDLGLAAVRDATEGELRGDAVVGTPAYMPPEQWRRGEAVSPAIDVYALGCTLFELLTGRTPFPVSEHPDLAAQRRAHLELEPQRVSAVAAGIPADVADLVARCLDKRPAGRPQDCAAIAAALELHAAPVVTADLLAGPQATGAATKAAFDAFVAEPRVPDTSQSRLRFGATLAACCGVAQIGLAAAYFGPAATEAWRLRFGRLADPLIPVAVGFTIEAVRSALFLTLVFTVAYLQFRLPLQRFLSPRLNTPRVWIARGIFGSAMLAFLWAEWQRQWFPAHAATEMVAWAAAHDITTTSAREVVPYRWYLGYSFVHYLFVFGGLLVLPLLQFLLVDLNYSKRAMALFTAAQQDEPNGMDAVDRLYGIARVLRRLAIRYVDVGGVLAIGVQFEYWIGRWTLSGKGYLIEVVGMVVTAGMMVLILAYVMSRYASAIEITAATRRGPLDHRIGQRLEQFSVGWFLKSAVLSRPSGMALISLVVLAFIVGRRTLS